jgi:hypothetical protein
MSVSALVAAPGDERFCVGFVPSAGSRCSPRRVLGVDGARFSIAFDKGTDLGPAVNDGHLGAAELQKPVEEFKALVVAHTGRDFPKTRGSSWTWPPGPCSAHGTPVALACTAGASASPMTWKRRQRVHHGLWESGGQLGDGSVLHACQATDRPGIYGD